MAITAPGEQMREPFRKAIAAFETDHPGTHVELIEMDGEVYQKMGLVTLFVGGNPPDIYFQWGGYQVAKWARAGYALDLTDQFPPIERRRYYRYCWESATAQDGRIYLWPDTASITTVIWYRRSILERLRAVPPTTWSEWMELCRRCKQVGITPLAVGNRELWPGGNFAAAVIAQRAGRRRYAEVLSLEPGTRLDAPEFAAGLGLVEEFHTRGFLNQGVDGVGTDEARSLLSQGRAATHPIGDWLVTDAPAEDVKDLDAFLLPTLPGQPEANPTLLALSTGYMINRTTRYPDEARALLRHLTSDAVQRDWTQAGHISAIRAAAPGSAAPAGQRRLIGFLEHAEASALAPDIGFDLEVSDAFLDAVSLVLGGRATARDALAGAERQVASLRRGKR
jgi:raffinose/stachyose/melibiose transport system substrate-binding protein